MTSQSLVPAPASVELTGAPFVLAPDTVVAVAADPAVRAVGEHLATALGRSVVEPSAATGAGAIVLALDAAADADAATDLGDEGYELTVNADGAELRASTPAGLFRGAQTVRQLAVGGELPGGRIRDRPRYPWRGMMLDVARHFFSVDDVKRLIELIALYKLNVLHLHLSDDQGWRLAMASRPRLTELAADTAVGEGPGGFYTQADYAEIVAHAARHHVTVVPEIDLPGHTNAALVAYPELACDGVEPRPYRGVEVGFSSLCPDKPETYAFVRDVVAELAALTPGGHLHLGGDEALSTPPDAYRLFLDRVTPVVVEHGKRVVGWQEVAKTALPPDSVVQYWDMREPDLARRAVRAGARVVMSPADRVYLDMRYDAAWTMGNDWAGLVEVRDAYDWDPDALVEGVTGTDVLGVEAALWTEYVATLADVETMTFPRLPAIAEVAWSPQKAREWNGFRARLAGQAELWGALEVRFYASPQVEWSAL